MQKTIAIIQARMGSSRLSGKVARLILGRPMLSLMLERVKRCNMLDKIIVATSDRLEDNKIVEIAKSMEVGYFCGSENDVLDRYYQAMKNAGASKNTIILCLLADCPLQDPNVIEEGLKHFIDAKDQYAFAGTVLNYPEGLDFNVFSFEAFEEAAQNAKLPSEREHIARYFINHPERFQALQWKTGDYDYSSMHWSVDTQADFDFVTKVFDHLYPSNPNFNKDDIINLLLKNPEIMEINKGGTGYEGLAKSLKEDDEFKKKNI